MTTTTTSAEAEGKTEVKDEVKEVAALLTKAYLKHGMNVSDSDSSTEAREVCAIANKYSAKRAEAATAQQNEHVKSIEAKIEKALKYQKSLENAGEQLATSVANVSEGDWVTTQTQSWIDAAVKARGNFYAVTEAHSRE